MEVHRPGVPLVVGAPDHVEELVAREGPSGVAHEEEQQLELAGLQGQHLAGLGGLARLRIQDEGAVGHRARAERATGPPQQVAHASHQLGEVERLDDVVVGARLQAGHALLRRVARREDQDGDAATRRAQLAHEVEAVAVRQAEVEDQGPELVLERGLRVLQRHGDLGVESLLVEGLEQLAADAVVVLDEEQAGVGAGHGGERRIEDGAGSCLLLHRDRPMR